MSNEPNNDRKTNNASEAAAAIGRFLKDRNTALKTLCGSQAKADRLVAVAMKAIQGKPELLNCDHPSLYNAVRLCAELDLEPNALGWAYFVPFKNSVTFLIGYRGMMELAARGGTRMDAHAIYENDLFDFEYGLTPTLKHKPTLGERGDLIGAYAVAWPMAGQPIFKVLSRDEIERRKMRGGAASKNTGPWNTDYEAMACKTAVRALFSLIPMTSQMERAQEIEDGDTAAEAPELEATNTPAQPAALAANNGRSNVMEKLAQTETREAVAAVSGG